MISVVVFSPLGKIPTSHSRHQLRTIAAHSCLVVAARRLTCAAWSLGKKRSEEFPTVSFLGKL